MNDLVMDAIVANISSGTDSQILMMAGKVKERLVKAMVESRYEMDTNQLQAEMAVLIKEEAKSAGLRITAH